MPSRHFTHNPVTGDALHRVHVHSSHRSGIGPARDVPAPPSARGVRTWEGRNLLRPSGRQAHPQHEEYPNLRPVNTERAEVRRHGGFLELAYAHLNHAACNLHGLGCDKRSPPVSSQNSTASPIYGGTRLSRPQSRWFCKCLCMVKRSRFARSTSLPRPLLCRPKGVSVCSVVKNTLPSGHHVDETARKPTSKPLSVPPCLRLLRVNRPEANRTPRAEGSAGTSHAGPDGHTIPTRTCTHACFISAEQSLHTAAIFNHTT